MPQLIQPITKIIEKTKDGEITVNLNLTIKLEAGELSVTANPQPQKSGLPVFGIDDNEPKESRYEMPDLDNEGIIDFGKEV